MDVGSGSSGPRMGKSKLLFGISALILVAVLVTALVLASGMWAPSGVPGSTDEMPDDATGPVDEDTADNVNEPERVSGIASDFIPGASDMGDGWEASEIITDMTGFESSTNLAADSGAQISFIRYNSTGHLEYQVDISMIVFNTTEDATTYYNKTAVADRPSQGDPGVKPEIPVIIANVSVGDGGIIVDGPHITLGHEAKWLFFIDKNVVCGIAYHHAWSYDPLPNELLIDLANKVDAKIAGSIDSGNAL